MNPPASKAVVRAPWKEQMFLSLDACEKMQLNKDELLSLRHKIKKALFASMMDKHYWMREVKNGANSIYIWDILVAAVIINPETVTDEIKLPVDVNDVYSPSYGQTLAYRDQRPSGTQEVRIVLATDHGTIINMLRNLFDKL